MNVDDLKIEFPGTGETTNRQNMNTSKKMVIDLSADNHSGFNIVKKMSEPFTPSMGG